MSEHSIEIIGQKFSYPSSWHGVATIFFVCASIVTVAYIFDAKRIGAIGDAYASVQSTLKESEAAKMKAQKTIINQSQEIESLTKALADIKKKSPKEVNLDLNLLNKLKTNRNKTTKSFSSYLESQERLNDKVKLLHLECPDCVTMQPVPAQLNPELKARLDALVIQKPALEFNK